MIYNVRSVSRGQLADPAAISGGANAMRRRALRALRIAAKERQLRSLAKEMKAEAGAFSGRLEILRALDRRSPQRVEELARVSPVGSSWIEWLVETLCDDGLLERVHDGEAGAIRMTAEGRRVLDEIEWDIAVA